MPKPGESWLCKVMALNRLQEDLVLAEPKDPRISSEKGEVSVSSGTPREYVEQYATRD